MDNALSKVAKMTKQRSSKWQNYQPIYNFPNMKPTYNAQGMVDITTMVGLLSAHAYRNVIRTCDGAGSGHCWSLAAAFGGPDGGAE